MSRGKRQDARRLSARCRRWKAGEGVEVARRLSGNRLSCQKTLKNSGPLLPQKKKKKITQHLTQNVPSAGKQQVPGGERLKTQPFASSPFRPRAWAYRTACNARMDQKLRSACQNDSSWHEAVTCTNYWHHNRVACRLGMTDLECSASMQCSQAGLYFIELEVATSLNIHCLRCAAKVTRHFIFSLCSDCETDPSYQKHWISLARHFSDSDVSDSNSVCSSHTFRKKQQQQ